MIFSLTNVFGDDVAAQLRRDLPEKAAKCEPDKASLAGSLVVSSLMADPLFRLGAQPRAFSAPRLIHRAAGGDGPAFDDAIDGSAVLMRADVTVCMFLNDPSDYDGGELMVDAEGGHEIFKGPVGTCVMFPSSAKRRVERVSHGDRWTAEVKVQSLVRGPAERQILYDIGCAGYFLETFVPSDAQAAASLHCCREQLLRLWAEP